MVFIKTSTSVHVRIYWEGNYSSSVLLGMKILVLLSPLIPRAWDHQSISDRQQVKYLQIHFTLIESQISINATDLTPPTLGMLKCLVHIWSLPLFKSPSGLNDNLLWSREGKWMWILKLQLCAIWVGCAYEKMQSLEVNLCFNLRPKQSSTLVQIQPLLWNHVLSYAIIILHCKICGEISCGKHANRHKNYFMQYLSPTFGIVTLFSGFSFLTKVSQVWCCWFQEHEELQRVLHLLPF